MKTTADVVIIGGGIQGTSVVYHLAQRGITNVALVEMDLIGSGSSGRSAAMLMLSMPGRETIRLSQAAYPEYLHFGEELDEAFAFKQIGSMYIATPATEAELQRDIELQRSLGVPIEVLDPQQVKQVVPAMCVDDLVFGTFCRTDGVIDPHAVMQAYTRAARARGAEIDERVQAMGIESQNGRVVGVHTTEGLISTRLVVNAAGARAAEVGTWVGLKLPITNYQRHIFITDAFPEIPDNTPFVEDMDGEWYFRKEGVGMLLGMGREESKTPEPQFEWEFREKVIERAVARVPILENARILRGWAGIRALTPDNQPILGYAPGVEGFINCCGWGGHGVMHAPIGGILTSELIADGKTTTLDLAPFKYERFGTV
jgi:glycine/D-amino acid oxidase-like deaminating enzyme